MGGFAPTAACVGANFWLQFFAVIAIFFEYWLSWSSLNLLGVESMLMYRPWGDYVSSLRPSCRHSSSLHSYEDPLFRALKLLFTLDRSLDLLFELLKPIDLGVDRLAVLGGLLNERRCH